MNKFVVLIVVNLCILIALIGWGNRVFTYFAFRFIGVDIVEIEYDNFGKLESTVRIIDENKSHTVKFGGINPYRFFKGWIAIKELNGYTLISLGCRDSSWEEVYRISVNRYVASKWTSSTILFDKESDYSFYFGKKKNSIPWIKNNISLIEAQLMAIPDDRYSYYRSPRGDEVYFKRVRREPGILDKLMKEVESNDTLFVFQNPDCNPDKPRKVE